ncbi:MAG: hypothetical protein R3B41_01775 [Candidatus Doudnabacteria bacterium]
MPDSGAAVATEVGELITPQSSKHPALHLMVRCTSCDASQLNCSRCEGKGYFVPENSGSKPKRIL